MKNSKTLILSLLSLLALPGCATPPNEQPIPELVITKRQVTSVAPTGVRISAHGDTATKGPVTITGAPASATAR